MTEEVPIYVTRVKDMKDFGYVIHYTHHGESRALKIYYDGDYKIRGHGKSWRYPTYAIDKAVDMAGINNITKIDARVVKSYQIDNMVKGLRSYIGRGGRNFRIVEEKKVKTNYPSLHIPADTKVGGKKHKPINIRGDKYVHYASCSGMMAANAEKKKLQDDGFKVLVRKYGERRIHVYRGPRRTK